MASRKERLAAQKSDFDERNRVIEEQKTTTRNVQPTINLTEQNVRTFATPEQETQIKEIEKINPPVINLSEPEKERTLGGKILDVAASPKTTLVLAGTLAALTGVAIATGALGLGAAATTPGTIGTISGTITSSGKRILETSFKNITGKPAITSGVNKLFRYATNPKSIGLTQSLMKKAGASIGTLALVGTAVGTYPFAEFELAEATDKIGIAMFQAQKEQDFEKVEELGTYLDEMLDPNMWGKIISTIPFLNVVRSVRKNIAAAQKSAQTFRSLAANALAERDALAAEGFSSEFEKSRAESRDVELQQRKEDTTFFENQQAENRQKELEQRQRDSEYFNLIREGKFEEAQALLDQELKGGK